MAGSNAVVVTITNPFVGPRPIETGQRIFGRDREIEELYYLLSAERIVLLHSPSGAGKSSLIQAGLIPRLDELFDVWGPTRVNLQPPEGQLAGLNRYVRSAVLGFEARIPKRRQRPPELLSAMTLSEYVAGRPRRRSAPANIVLIFDQFEEILTVDPLALDAKHEFFDQVGKLLQDPHVWALFALREDYLAPLDPYAEEVPTHLKNRFRLDLLGREAAREAISWSAEQGGRRFAPEAVGKLVNDLATMQVQRPDGTFERQTGPNVEPLHLQVACRGLWERLPEDRRTIGLDDIQSFGDVTQALAEYYGKEVGEIAGGDPRVERAIREWIGEKLITADGIRGQVLKGAGESEGLDNELIGRLVDTHLVRGEQRAGALWYELSHDRLVEPVRTNNKKWFEAHLSKVQKVAAVWEAQGRPEGLLLLGADLVEARQWAAINESALTGVERKFLEASEAKQGAIRREQRQTKRLRLALGVAITLAIAAGVAAGWAYFEKRRAARSEHDAIVQKGIAEEKTKQVQVALARSDVQAADDEVHLKDQPSQALAHVAHALRIDPESVATRNWVADLLLRKDWWVMLVALKHKGTVSSAALSRDGRRIVTGSEDRTAQVWDADTGKPVGPPLQHKGSVNSVAFSPDGRRVVTGSVAGTGQVWDAGTGKPVGAPLQHKGGVGSTVFSGDGRWVVTVSADHTAQVWEAETSKPVGAPLRHKDVVWWAAFSPDGRRVVTASMDDTAQVWDAGTGRPIGMPLQHKAFVFSAVFSPDGRRVVTASLDGTAQVWDVDTSKPVGATLEHNGAVDYSMMVSSPEDKRALKAVLWAAFSPDGRRVVTASVDGTAQVWEADTGKPVGPPLRHKFYVVDAEFSADGERVVTASSDGTAQVWEAGTGKPVGVALQHGGAVVEAAFAHERGRVLTVSSDTAQLWEPDIGKPIGQVLQHKDGVRCAVFSRDGRRVVTASSDGTAQVWEANTGKPVGPPLRHKDSVLSAAFSDDGRRVVTASMDSTGQVWEADTGRPVGIPLKHKDAIWLARFSPDGRRVVTASADGTAQVWEADTGKPVGMRLQHKNSMDYMASVPLPKGEHAMTGVLSAVFSVDGRRVVTASADGTAQMWEADTGKPIGPPLQHKLPVWSAEFSPDGRRVVTASFDFTAQVWDADTGKPVGPALHHKSLVVSAAFSADGRRVVTASSDGTAQVWDINTGKPVGAPLQHKGIVWSAAFSPDGQRVVTGSQDGTAQVWAADTGKPIGTPLQHQGIVRSAVFSPDGRKIVTASEDHTAQVWQVLLGSDSPQDTALLADLAEAVSGYRVNESGSVVPLGLDERMTSINRLRDAYHVPIQENFLVWFLRYLSASGPTTKSAR